MNDILERIRELLLDTSKKVAEKPIRALPAALALLLLIGGIYLWVRAERASEQEAMQKFEQLLWGSADLGRGQGAAPPPDYEAVLEEHRGTRAGLYAALLAGSYRLRTGEASEARRLFEEARSGSPAGSRVGAAARIGIAACLEAQGDLEGAMQLYREVYRKAPRDLAAPARFSAMRLLARLGEDEKALEQYEALQIDHREFFMLNNVEPWADRFLKSKNDETSAAREDVDKSGEPPAVE